jgi:hypothetical protein
MTMDPNQILRTLLQAPSVGSDPGNAGTFVIDRDALLFPIVTAAAETRTLPAPVKEGIRVGLIMKTDGGDCTVTVGSAFNEAGRTTLVFDAAGACVLLYSVPYGSGFRWRVLMADGVYTELGAFPINVNDWRGPTGLVLTASETAGSFFVQVGTNQYYLQGEETNNETEVSVIRSEFTLPPNYVAGSPITLRLGTDITGSGTNGASTIDASAYLQSVAGTVGDDLVETSAISVSTTEGNKDVVITPTGLVAGDKLVLKVTASVIESASSAIRMLITRSQILCGIKA